MSSATKKKKINSVSKFLKFIENNIIQLNSKDKIYFRGNADKDWKDEPSIYRYPNLIKNEHNIYHEMISRIPQEFIDCKTAFDHLVKMQHYGLPTRLLDITSDPLVALFFACSSHEDKDGKITIYNIPATDVKVFDSDTVSIIANLAKMKEFNLINLKFLIEFFRYATNTEEYSKLLPKNSSIDVTNYNDVFVKILREISEKEHQKRENSNNTPDDPYENNMESIYYLDLSIKAIIKHKFLYYYDDVQKWECMDIIFLEINNKIITPFRRFIHFIKAEKSYFDSTQMNLEHISSVQFVEPKKDNPRIIKQNGAFLIFGLANNSNSKEATPKIPSNFYFKNKNNNIIEIIIPKEAKPNILKQLKMLSISESTLFPEADKIASEIKNKYLIDGN